MENATSIYTLQDEPSQRKMPVPVMSYSDVLKNMQEEPPVSAGPTVPVQPQPQHQPPQDPPMVQFQPQAPVVVEPDIKTPIPEINDKYFQNDMLVLLAVYIVVHMTSVQKWIQTKVPNLVNPDGHMSVLGMLMNGVLVIVMWNVAKKMVAKYLKEL